MASPEIFISYRKNDSGVFAQWLAHQLRLTFGAATVFIDTKSIRSAEHWSQKILNSLTSSSIVLAVIGPEWLAAKDELGGRRIDSPTDWVRQEIDLSFRLGKTVLPIALCPVEKLEGESVPPCVSKIFELQFAEVSNQDIAGSIEKITGEVGRLLGREMSEPTINLPFPLQKLAALTGAELDAIRQELPDWKIVSNRVLPDGKSKIELMRVFAFQSFDDAIHFINTVSRFATRLDHHPDWTNIWRTVVVYLTTWDIGHKPSKLDIVLGRHMDAVYKTQYEVDIARP